MCVGELIIAVLILLDFPNTTFEPEKYVWNYSGKFEYNTSANFFIQDYTQDNNKKKLFEYPDYISFL